MVAGLANTGIDIGEHLSVEENREKLARKIGDAPRWVVDQFKSRMPDPVQRDIDLYNRYPR